MFLDFLSWRNPAEKFTIYSSYETENIIGKGEKTIMKMKKVTAMGMAVLMAATMIPAVPAMADDAGKVYYLNFKPEQDEAWQNLAKEYTEETGTEVTVVTAASGQYETTLQSEMAKSDAPTLFQVQQLSY